ncbi:SUMO-specific isopeptidase USPL1 [Hydra vulgaris]|uniref:SUMO-specific isopeptidase USPL1 n=1 Tax=Hydra vulgaris TaxID=6087 RepID=UPI001F5EE60D|nr:SUMO-specific isopeptidase USPL1 [Hydra vulgaris]XP_047144913.1 SUMO-specific isopeptidase USPL1 [Hydra vulgaris]
MINFTMTVNRFCMECMKDGEFQQLQFVMINLQSGMWLCPNTKCTFPMNSSLLKDYIEDNITSEKALFFISKKKRKQKKRSCDDSELTVDNVKKTSHGVLTSSECSTSSLGSPTVTDSNGCSGSEKSFKNDNIQKYPFWENDKLLCWLNTSLSLLILNTTIQKHIFEEKRQCFLSYICEEYAKIQSIYQTKNSYSHARKYLQELRYTTLKFLEARLFAKYKDGETPSICLPILLKTDLRLYEKVKVNYSYQFKCQNCQVEGSESFQKVMITIPHADTELKFGNNISFKRTCTSCNHGTQDTTILIERYPPLMFCHFLQGVHNQMYWKDLSFTTPSGEKYIVTQIVQYVNKRRHFLLWSFSHLEKLWLCADDLNDPVTEYKFAIPQCPASEVYILVWEKVESLSFEKVLKEQCRSLHVSKSCGYASATSSLDGFSPIGSPCQVKSSMVGLRYKPYVSRNKHFMANNSITLSDTVLSSKNDIDKLTDNYPDFDMRSIVDSDLKMDGGKNFNPLLDNILERVNAVLDSDFNELLMESSNNQLHSNVSLDMCDLDMLLN